MGILRILLFAFLLLVPRSGLAARLWVDLGAGWKMAVDTPDYAENIGKMHVHVYNEKGQIGVENVDGTPSHGSIGLDNVPKSVKEKVRDHQEYKKAQKKQKKLDEAMSEIDAKKLDTQRVDTRDVLIAAAIVMVATATAFFPADDAVAWVNFFRVVRAAY
jgi:hypothetical protein